MRGDHGARLVGAVGPEVPVRARSLFFVLLLALVASGLTGNTCNAPKLEPKGQHNFLSPQADPVVLDAAGAFLYVAATTSDRVDVIDTSTGGVVARIAVGMEPVSLAIRPGGAELWVSNHLSDTVSVVDLNAASATFHQVVDTIQDLDANGVTRFDEPVGIAFASAAKAYVALSSRDQIAVVDAATRAVTGHIDVRGQEPRDIAVHGGFLYVPVFESGNQTQISYCDNAFGNGLSGNPCSLGQFEANVFVTRPNIPGATKNIVVEGAAPDRDLFVYRTSDEAEVDVVDSIGTLLYGVAVDSTGRVFLSQTDARNAENGDDGENLIDLENRLFDNEIATLDCGGGSCGSPTIFPLEPTLPSQPAPGSELATPYGIQVSDDDATLVVTAAGTSRVFAMSATTGAVLGIADVGSIPRGVALRSNAGTGAAETAYVLNTLGNSISVVDVSTPAAPVVTDTITVGADPTPLGVRRGRIAFNDAFASSSGTFSCASCHPDGNTDQLLWRIGGACSIPGCDGNDEPRTTMPVRGLRNTLPLHWDGTLGDPFGGANGAIGNNSEPANCTDDHSCFLHLVGESLGGVMCDQDPVSNPAGCPAGGNELDAIERDHMATFLASVAYPPARSRRIDDSISRISDGTTQVGSITVGALEGFQDFMTNQGGSSSNPNTCADSDAGCHALPLTADTSSSTLEGFDVPTMRGMTDRYLQFSLGFTHTQDLLAQANTGTGLFFSASPLEAPIQYSSAVGFEEVTAFGAAFLVFEPVYGVRPLDMFQMFEEASTGTSGAVGRQVTLNATTASAPELSATEALLASLEAADLRGAVNLRGAGRRDTGAGLQPIELEYDLNNDQYKNASGSLTLPRATLLSEAAAGDLVMTFTGYLRRQVGIQGNYEQPLLAPDGPGSGPTGDPGLPMLPGDNPMRLAAVDVRANPAILVDGAVAWRRAANRTARGRFRQIGASTGRHSVLRSCVEP